MKIRRTLLAFMELTVGVLAGVAAPFQLSDGTTLDVLEMRKTRGVVEWVKLSYNPPQMIPTPWGSVPVRDTLFLYPDRSVRECSMGYKAPLEEDTAQLNTPYGNLRIKGKIGFHTNGTIASLEFKGIHQLPIPIGEAVPALRATFHPNGALKSIAIPSWNLPRLRILGRDAVVSELEFHENGTPKYAKFKDPCPVLVPVGLVWANRIWLYDNGRIEAVVLAEPKPLSGLPVEDVPIRSLGWHPQGELGYVELSKVTSLETPMGRRMVKGALYWHPNGQIKELTFSEDFPELTLPALGKVRVSGATYRKDGSCESLSFPEPTPIRSPAGTVETKYMELYPEGGLKSAPLSDAGKTFPLSTPLGTLMAGWHVTFYENGALESLSFKPLTAHEIYITLGTKKVKVWITDTIKFYSDGALKSVKLSTATELPTPLGLLPLDGDLSFYPTGDLQEVNLGWHPRLGMPARVLLPEVGEAQLGNISFYPGGRVKEAEVIEEGQFGGLFIDEYEVIQFSEEGKLLTKLPPRAKRGDHQ